ncbi:MAG: FAD-dependent oxidoreductase [Candidatus Abawacabacteria bacterium]|nr:FAD-dependent oxidoreductase [Candidatus Abawacabacteria bacterium]
MTTRIVVVGAGVAGYTAVEFLRKSPINKDIKILWIAPQQKFVYKPFLFDIVSNYKKLNEYIFPLENYCERFHIDFTEGTVTQFLPSENALILASGVRVNYEYLLIATGEERQIPQHLVSPNTLAFQTTKDIEIMLKYLDEQFAAGKKQLSLLRKPFLSLAMIANSLTSIEMLFALYNYTEMLRKKYDLRRNEINISYITAEKQFGGDIPLKLSDTLEQYGHDHDVDIYMHQVVTRIENNKVVLSSGTTLETNTILVEGESVLANLYKNATIKADEFGGIKVNNYLQLEDFYNIYACGSIINFYDWHKKEKAWHTFNTAQAQAKLAASNVVAEIRGRNKQAYKPQSGIELIPVNDQLSIGVYGDAVYFNSIMHYTRMFFATKYLWQLTMPES